MAAKKRHPHRKPLLGLTPEKVVEEMARVASGKVRSVRRSSYRTEEPVLSKAREGDAERAGTGGLPGTDSGPEISDAPGNPGDTFSVQLSRVLKRMLGEKAPGFEGIREGVTNAEALAAVIQREALGGRQWACEFWRDMVEGKPVRAAQQDNTDQEVESQLDRVSIAALNRLTETKES